MSESSEKEMVVGYFPVLHKGYLDLLNNHPEADIGVLDSDILSRFDYLRKDIRALEPSEALELLQGTGRNAVELGEAALKLAVESERNIIMPDDDVSNQLVQEFDIKTAILKPVFLRWDRRNTIKDTDVVPDQIIAMDSDDSVIKALYASARKSPNWWRHVAAAVVNSEAQIDAIHFNTSVPTEYSSAIDGDPRITARRGEAIERSIDIHAETKLIAEYARKGESTLGKSIYVTTFPCANCAKLIAESGFSRCYFIEGYATIDGQSILKASGVKLIKIITDTPEPDPQRLRPYPTS